MTNIRDKLSTREIMSCPRIESVTAELYIQCSPYTAKWENNPKNKTNLDIKDKDKNYKC